MDICDKYVGVLSELDTHQNPMFEHASEAGIGLLKYGLRKLSGNWAERLSVVTMETVLPSTRLPGEAGTGRSFSIGENSHHTHT